MSQSIMGEGTKIAQAAKDLNVTSVTVRRYLSEFGIQTMNGESGIMVLPPSSVAELSQVRKFKEDGLSNQEILNALADSRPPGARQVSVPPAPLPPPNSSILASNSNFQFTNPAHGVHSASSALPSGDDSAGNDLPQISGATDSSSELAAGITEQASAARPKHSLVCQTCSKPFEHSNPRLRDCLDCYRAKRKERRRGSAPRVVIQHPLAKQAARSVLPPGGNGGTEITQPQPLSLVNGASFDTKIAATHQQHGVRNYRKAIDETRHITSNLKRRLDRADLPDGERKWLEQIYAYQLILHQGWRHLAEYRSAGTQGPQPQAENSESPAAANEI